ncbi:hypothetical protein C8Q74DRAFT_1211191 [Fomes fomentarius]|nr:hypothetical protein C8Q74DRAFT_1211191 [Fomes fomentarius]
MSSAYATGRKRPRTGSVDSHGGNERQGEAPQHGKRGKRDEEFWLEDGTVILVARDVGFRVYAGLLAAHSPVLKGLFDQSHPTCKVSSHRGEEIQCPIVHLSDSPEDVRYILRVYMPNDDATPYDSLDPSFELVSASIRLGRKYQMTTLYEKSLRFLKDHYTSDFDAWRKRGSWDPDGWDGWEPIGVVNLARLMGEPSILPTAFLSCMALEHQVLFGFEREDGYKEVLTMADLGICFKANKEIIKDTIAIVLRTLQSRVSSRCSDASRCKGEMLKARRGLDVFAHKLVQGNLLLSYRSFVDGDRVHVCTSCRKMLNARLTDEYRKIWNRLPDLLGIEVPGWGEPVQANGM